MLATARSMVWGPLVGAAGGLVVLVLCLRPWQGGGLSLAVVRVTAAIAAAAAAFALDDPAASTLGASPTALAGRRAARVAWVVLGCAATSGLACLTVVVAAGVADVPAGRALLECTGMLLAVTALALLVGADRGVAVFAGAMLAALVVQIRFPQYSLFPSTTFDPSWHRAGVAWGGIVVGGAALIVHLSRDPAAGRGPRRASTGR